MCLWNTNAPATAIVFRKLCLWYITLTLTLTDDLDFGTKIKVLPRGIYLYVKYESSIFTIQELWPM